MKRFFLESLKGPEENRKWEVWGSITLGRTEGNDIRLSGSGCESVSARHALVALKGDRLWLRDLDSTNGSYIGKMRVIERELLGGEIISLGQGGPAFRVLTEDAPDLVPDSESEEPGTRIFPFESIHSTDGRDSRNQSEEMASNLRGESASRDIVRKLIHEPGHIRSLVQNGLVPYKMARLMYSAAMTHSDNRKKFLRAGGVLGTILLTVILVLIGQNMRYRYKINKQSELLAQIRDLERSLAHFGQENNGEMIHRSQMVHRLMHAEQQLFEIRETLRLPDREEPYQTSLAKEIHQVLEGLGKRGFIVPESFVEKVSNHIDSFCQAHNRVSLQSTLAKKRIYAGMIQSELKRMKLPQDFIYLALQESAFDPLALSSQDARGLWQFIPETARTFQLRVPQDWKSLPPEADERTHPKASTRAAARFLHGLLSEFGDPALAMAAYNAGPGKVRKVLRRIEDPVQDRDFWYLYRMGFLADETNEYVPRILAAIIIDRNRIKYGFLPEPGLAVGKRTGNPERMPMVRLAQIQ